MKDWAGTGEAYAASYAALCAGTAPALLAVLGDPAGRSLLDVGAGTGLLTAALAEAGWTATGCEPEPTIRAVAARRHPQLPIVTGGLPDLPFGDGAFDAVIANFVLNHVADPPASARELARVARERVVATVWTSSPTWLWLEVCERAGLAPAAGERLPPEKDFARTTEGFERMLRCRLAPRRGRGVHLDLARAATGAVGLGRGRRRRRRPVLPRPRPRGAHAVPRGVREHLRRSRGRRARPAGAHRGGRRGAGALSGSRRGRHPLAP